MDIKTAHILEEKERTEDIAIEENVTFEELYLSDAVLSGLTSCGFIRPSPIQLSAIPLGRCGLDLIVQAKSGTGKTIVFTVVALEMISVNALTTQVLVIAPTREIAVQIGLVINSVGSSFPGLKASTFIGGIHLQEDKAKLKCCHIAIGTPGRLIQLVELGFLNLSNVRLLVLDEADQLLTGEFKNSILEVVKTLPFNKQVLALSATYPHEVTEFLDQYMRSPSHVRLGKDSPALIGVNQFVMLLPDHPQSHMRHKYKYNELLGILSSLTFNQCLVFSNSQLRAESICNQLKSSGWPASYLTGGQMQSERLQSFYALCSYKCRILVSTDLSARGLDSEHVNLVINLDVPSDQATYLHRVGRAGRFGSMGIAISLVCEGEEWESMRAVVTLTNIIVRILPQDFDSATLKSDYKSLEVLQHLDEDDCTKYLLKQNEKKSKYKKVTGKKESYTNSILKQKQNRKAKKNVYKSDVILSNDKIVSPSEVDIQKEEDENINGSKVQIVKPILNDFLSETKFYNFSYDEICDKVSAKYDNISRYDCEALKKNKILKKYPTSSAFNDLEKYIHFKEKELSTIKDETFISKENLNSIENLQQCLKRFDLTDGYQEQKSSEIESKETLETPKIIQMVNSSPENSAENKVNESNNDDNRTFSIEANYDKASHIEAAAVPLNDTQLPKDPENTITANSNSTKSGRQSTSQMKKKKEYSENTGYGEWVPVTSSHKEECTSTYQFEENDFCETNIDEKQSTSKCQSHYPSHVESESKFSYHESLSGYNGYSQYYNSLDAYVRSAQKYAMMMEYVRTIGKMSAWIAHDSKNMFHSHLNKKFPNK